MCSGSQGSGRQCEMAKARACTLGHTRLPSRRRVGWYWLGRLRGEARLASRNQYHVQTLTGWVVRYDTWHGRGVHVHHWQSQSWA